MSIFKNNGKEIDNYLNHWTETGKTVNFSLRSLSPFSTVNRTTIKKQDTITLHNVSLNYLKKHLNLNINIFFLIQFKSKLKYVR